MPLKKLTLLITAAHEGKRLDHVLSEWLPQALSEPVSKAKARQLIVAGAVYLNGKRVRIASKTLRSGARVDAYVDLEKLRSGARSTDRPFVMDEARVLFEDEYLIAVNKPPGLPTQPTLDEARKNLHAEVRRFLSLRNPGGPAPYLGLHHRLDRDTSGVVLFTKAPEANAGVGALFAEHRAQKVYQALAARPNAGAKNAGAPKAGKGVALPPDEWSVKNYLGKVAARPTRMGSVRSGGDYAYTEFRLLEAFPRGLWIEARPRTGRTHQIRVHLAEAGMPILGDPTYGGGDFTHGIGVPRLMLHAASLTFEHPITRLEISIQSPLPEDFNSCLQLLRRGGALS